MKKSTLLALIVPSALSFRRPQTLSHTMPLPACAWGIPPDTQAVRAWTFFPRSCKEEEVSQK